VWAVFEGSPGLNAGAAVKDRRRNQRAMTTGRELVSGKESPSSAAGSLNRVLRESGLRRWCCPYWNGSTVLERPTPGASRAPDVKDGVAQDRKRQEP
jgi:hypothetical protein